MSKLNTQMENKLEDVAAVYWNLYKHYEKGESEINRAIDDWSARRYLGNDVYTKIRYAQYISKTAFDLIQGKSSKDLKGIKLINEHVIPKEKYVLNELRKIAVDESKDDEKKEELVSKIIKNRHSVCLITKEQNDKITAAPEHKKFQTSLPENVEKKLSSPDSVLDEKDVFSRYIKSGAMPGEEIYKIISFDKNENGKIDIKKELYYKIPE